MDLLFKIFDKWIFVNKRVNNTITLSCHEQECLSARYNHSRSLPDDGRSISRNVAHLKKIFLRISKRVNA